jgi:hypothetical protein
MPKCIHAARRREREAARPPEMVFPPIDGELDEFAAQSDGRAEMRRRLMPLMQASCELLADWPFFAPHHRV